MKPQQKIVAIGAASGILSMLLLVWLLTAWLPPPIGIESTAERIAYALRVNVVAILPFFAMIVTVANSRFLSDAIDPTLEVETRVQRVDGRVTDNTLQQNFVFAVASLALATVVPAAYLQALWACATVFFIARLVFWFGYRKHPLYRAPGMSATAYLNLGMILYVLYAISFGR